EPQDATRGPGRRRSRRGRGRLGRGCPARRGGCGTVAVVLVAAADQCCPCNAGRPQRTPTHQRASRKPVGRPAVGWEHLVPLLSIERVVDGSLSRARITAAVTEITRASATVMRTPVAGLRGTLCATRTSYRW